MLLYVNEIDPLSKLGAKVEPKAPVAAPPVVLPRDGRVMVSDMRGMGFEPVRPEARKEPWIICPLTPEQLSALLDGIERDTAAMEVRYVERANLLAKYIPAPKPADDSPELWFDAFGC